MGCAANQTMQPTRPSKSRKIGGSADLDVSLTGEWYPGTGISVVE
jgi:hypothetical protein